MRPQPSLSGLDVCAGPGRTGLNGMQLQPCVQPLDVIMDLAGRPVGGTRTHVEGLEQAIMGQTLML